MNLDVILGILLPFAGTTLGAAMVFFMRKEVIGLLTILNIVYKLF